MKNSMCVSLAIGIATLISSCTNNSPSSENRQPSATKDSLVAANMAVLDSMEREAKLNILNDISKYSVELYKGAKASVVAQAPNDFRRWDAIASEFIDSQDAKEKEIGMKAIKMLASTKARAFPLLRKYWGDAAAADMWEHDIEVRISGKGNTVVTFTGGAFAANANIKNTQGTLSETVEALRFKQTRYKWYSGDEEFTYYTIESKADTESAF
jgi:hypothetical protein